MCLHIFQTAQITFTNISSMASSEKDREWEEVKNIILGEIV